VAAQAAAIITGTEAAREDIIRHYRIRPERVTVIPYGVDDRFRSTPDAALVAQLRSRLAPGAPLALFSGSPGPRKNLDVVLRCLASAPPGDLLRDVHLVISGNTGGAHRDYRRVVDEHGLSERVQWLDRVPTEEMSVLYAAADVLLYPSIYEGFGLPPLEAMSVGTPVIAARASCLPEVLDDAAILVAPHDDRALGDAIRNILKDSRLTHSLVERGRDRASTFTWARSATQTADLYARVLAG
jgi:glycosyltransferase involved in cell wall biosynthesis